MLANREAWCEGEQFAQEYENKKGRVKERHNLVSTPVDRLRETWRESGSGSDTSNVSGSGFYMVPALQDQGASVASVKSSPVSIPSRPQPVFTEKDFPPLSSSGSEGPGTPPRKDKQHPQGDRRPETSAREAATAVGPGLQSDSPESQGLSLQRANALLRESASLPGRGRAGALLRHAALPEVRLPAEYGESGYHRYESSGADRYDGRRSEYHFPADEELLAAPEVVPVPNHQVVGGSTVRIRRT